MKLTILDNVGKTLLLCTALYSTPVAAEELATTAAVADTVTTLAVLANGGNEVNPLLGSNPAVIVAVGLAKIALINYIKDHKEYTGRINFLTGLWSVGAVNNILLLIGAATPVALVGGIAGGIVIYNHVKE